MAFDAFLHSPIAAWLQHCHLPPDQLLPRGRPCQPASIISRRPNGSGKQHGSIPAQPCQARKRQQLHMQAKASRSEAASAAANDSPASASGHNDSSAGSSAVELEGSHALPGPSRAKRKKAARHQAPQAAAQEAAEEIPQPDPPSPDEIRIAKALLAKMQILRRNAPNSEELIAELGDPDPDDPMCIAEIVDHMRLSHAIDPVGGIPQEEEASHTNEHAWRPIPSPYKHLFEPRYGLPIVRRYLTYGELLKEVRMEQVLEVAFFCEEKFEDEVEGPCLVIFKDGTVAQSHVPEADFRLPYAMETHAVKMTQLMPEPAADSIWYGDPKGSIAIPAQKFLVSSLPVIGLIAAYVAARFAKYLKGGFDDRQKLRRAEIQRNKELKKQAEVDDLVLEPRRMAEAGEGVASIVAAMQRLGSPMSEADAQAVVDDVKDQDRRRAELRSEGIATASDPQEEARQRTERQRARQQAAAESEEASAMDRMQNFSRMRSVKVQPKMSRTDMEAQARMRAVGRKMKGVKLQYTADDRVFFDDVAGIGQAKVRQLVDGGFNAATCTCMTLDDLAGLEYPAVGQSADAQYRPPVHR